ncbi:hypothetical protein [Hamadaea tsunoensis]|uniref:hypothetical protein n=1 Tax=Hamadaea tsunoensis TaxID=53368 RepID=UPI000488F7FB|nr:hypothetical protein [Hamadaea tsunoensis]
MTSDAGTVVVAFERVGDLRFGGTRTGTRALLGAPNESFRRGAAMAERSDLYRGHGLILSFRAGGLLASVELIPPAEPAFDGVPLLSVPARQVVETLEQRGLDVTRSRDLWIVRAAGLALSARGGQAGDEPFDAVEAYVADPPGRIDFFEPAAPVGPPDLTVYADRVGPVALGAVRSDVRQAFGPGMASTMYAEPVDTFFAGLTVEYDEADQARRLCVTKPGARTGDGLAAVGESFDECLAALGRAGVAHVVGEAEIDITGSGVRAAAMRAGDGSLPVSSLAIRTVRQP